MERSLLLRNLILGFVAFLFLFPLLNILRFVSFESTSWDPYLIKVLWGAFLQSLLSVGATILLSFFGALGFIAWERGRAPGSRQLVQFLSSLPCFIPPLIVVVLGMKATQWVSLPVGLEAIVFFHTLMNVGIVSLILIRLIKRVGEPWVKLCLVEGVSSSRFLIRGLLPGLFPEIRILSLFLFVLYFFSFSIPLLVGDLSYGGVEVFIYEKIFLFGQWGEALLYSMMLVALMTLLSFFVVKQPPEPRSGLQARSLIHYYSSSWWMFFMIWPILLLGAGLCMTLLTSSVNMVWPSLQAVRGTLLIGLWTGVVVLVLLSLLAYCFAGPKVSRWTFSIVSPSWVVVGFSFFLLGSDQTFSALIKTGLALGILYLPYVYRVSFYSKLTSLERQVDVAQLSGASWNRIYFVIIWPQVLPTICFLSGLAALWACGDFALAGMLLPEDLSIALQMKSLIDNYRLDQAMGLLFPLIIISALIFLIFQGFSYVSRRNFLS